MKFDMNSEHFTKCLSQESMTTGPMTMLISQPPAR